jgi:hypothetical protein
MISSSGSFGLRAVGEARTDSDGAAAHNNGSSNHGRWVHPHFKDVDLGHSRISLLRLGSETHYLRKVGTLGQGGSGVVVLVKQWDGKGWILVALKWVYTGLNENMD